LRNFREKEKAHGKECRASKGDQVSPAELLGVEKRK